MLLLFLALAAVHLAGLAAAPAGTAVAHATKPALALALAGYTAARRGPWTLVVALLCGCAGDTLLQLDGDTAFLAGMGCFAAGHIAYLVLFTRMGGFSRARRRTYVLAACYAAVWAVSALVLGADVGALRAPLTGYGLLLAAMALGAAGPGPRTGTGGALFVLSDGLIATGLAHWPRLPGHQFWIMLTYLAAQYLLTTGVLDAAATPPRGRPAARSTASSPPSAR
ncbi:hypothetical protein SCATT_10180 [Streptantibioticus cattleyicolor NRRL 8057 = DSM 46488]|uniref:Lysoplasmalogenase n=1 Tax=Streptantibioticus cattleyicolor (strain ATCC 35852 / DSM 46488 / JCM 4925 / NBRC 14057 / NRRL 8057) TaxID=1003195 RepID=G8WNR6_STREN|nr:hypothetical protein SCATT_10180 [Streptantibioticus cattleyicolor NRRL 8057 = DSM 46488]